MNHYLDLIGMLSKTNLELEMTRIQVVVKCANGTHLSIISNGYGCEDGLLELMPYCRTSNATHTDVCGVRG